MKNMYQNLWRILSEQKENYKNKPVITFGEIKIYYEELIYKIEKVSIFLNKVNAARVIRISLDDPIEITISALGALISNRTFWIAHSKDANNFKSYELNNVFVIDSYAYKNSLKAKGNLEISPLISAKTPFCWAMSSGGLSIPKITEHSYQSICEDTYRQIDKNRITNEDRLDIISSIGFSASLSSIFPAIFVGASIHIKEQNPDIVSIYEFWKKEKITITTLIPSLFRKLLNFEFDLSLLHLRFICLGGEKVLHSDLELFKNNFKSQVLLQAALASSEARTIAEFIFSPVDKIPEGTSIPYKSVHGKKILILDNDLNKLENGKPGNIAIQSNIIGSRYVNRSENFNQLNNGERVFISDDLGIIESDGHLYLIDRNSRKRKLKGEFIDLDLLENLIIHNRYVLECYAELDETNGNLNIFIYSHISRKELKGWIINELKINSFNLFVLDSELPKLSSGKKNLLSLNKIKQQIYSRKTNEKKSRMYSIFREIFPDEMTFRGRHFFNDLGGDSLSALEFVVLASKKFNYSVNSNIVFEFPIFDDLELNLWKKKKIKLIQLNAVNDTSKNILIFPWLNGSSESYNQIINSFSHKFNIFKINYLIEKENKFLSTNQIAVDISNYLIAKKNTYSFFIGHSYPGLISYYVAHHSKLTKNIFLIDTPTFMPRSNLKRFGSSATRLIKNEIESISNIRTLKLSAISIMVKVKNKYITKNVDTIVNNDPHQLYYNRFFDFNKNVNKQIPFTKFNLVVFIASDQKFLNFPDFNWRKFNSHIKVKKVLDSDHFTILNKRNSEKIIKIIVESA